MGIGLGFHNHFTCGHRLVGGRDRVLISSSGGGYSQYRPRPPRDRAPGRKQKQRLLQRTASTGLVSTKARYVPTLQSSHSIPEHILSERRAHVHQKTHRVFITALLMTVPSGNQYTYPSTGKWTDQLWNSIQQRKRAHAHTHTHTITICKEGKNLTDIMSRKRNQTPKSMCCVVLFL